MEKERFEILTMEYLSGTLDAEPKKAFEKLLKDNSEYQQDFDEVQHAWHQMDSIDAPEPSEKMDARFYEMLYIGKSESKKNGLENLIRNIKLKFASMMRPQLAYGALLLCIGLGVGYILNSGDDIETKTIANTETEEIRGELVLTLLEQPSANKRLQGVNEANKFKKANDKVIKALLQTLNNDPNVNVRLAAIESLTNYLDNPLVREGLVQSIVKQESPIVQVTLADLMVALQEKKSIEPFKKLMRTKELDESVKEKLESSIQSII